MPHLRTQLELRITGCCLRPIFTKRWLGQMPRPTLRGEWSHGNNTGQGLGDDRCGKWDNTRSRIRFIPLSTSRNTSHAATNALRSLIPVQTPTSEPRVTLIPQGKSSPSSSSTRAARTIRFPFVSPGLPVASVTGFRTRQFDITGFPYNSLGTVNAANNQTIFKNSITTYVISLSETLNPYDPTLLRVDGIQHHGNQGLPGHPCPAPAITSSSGRHRLCPVEPGRK